MKAIQIIVVVLLAISLSYVSTYDNNGDEKIYYRTKRVANPIYDNIKEKRQHLNNRLWKLTCPNNNNKVIYIDDYYYQEYLEFSGQLHSEVIDYLPICEIDEFLRSQPNPAPTAIMSSVIKIVCFFLSNRSQTSFNKAKGRYVAFAKRILIFYGQPANLVNQPIQWSESNQQHYQSIMSKYF